jgi:hypothetical protein
LFAPKQDPINIRNINNVICISTIANNGVGIGFHKTELTRHNLLDTNTTLKVDGWDLTALVQYYHRHSPMPKQRRPFIRTLKRKADNLSRVDANIVDDLLADSHLIGHRQPNQLFVTDHVSKYDRQDHSHPNFSHLYSLTGGNNGALNSNTGQGSETTISSERTTTVDDVHANFKVNESTQVSGVLVIGGNPCVLLFPLSDTTDCFFRGFLLVEPVGQNISVDHIFADVVTATALSIPNRQWMRIDILVHTAGETETKWLPIMHVDTKNRKIVDIDYEGLRVKPYVSRKNATVACMILDLLQTSTEEGIQSNPKLLDGMGVFAVDVSADKHIKIYTVINKKKHKISTYILSDSNNNIAPLGIEQIRKTTSRIRDAMKSNGQWTDEFGFIDHALEPQQTVDWLDTVSDYINTTTSNTEMEGF